MAKYDADMNAFTDAGGGIKRKADTQATKDPAAPKKPVGGGFGCFLAQNRAAFSKDVKGQPVAAVTKLASKKWKHLSEDEKKVYQEEYEIKQAEYEQAKKLYVRLATYREAEKPVKNARLAKENKEANGNEDAEKAAQDKSAEKEIKATAKAKTAKATAKASPSTSRRPGMKLLPKSPFDCFYAQIRAGERLHFSVPISAIRKCAFHRWTMLGEDDKAYYREEYERAKSEYEAAKNAQLTGIDKEETEKRREIQIRSAGMSAFIDAGEKKGTKRKADKAVTTKDPTTPKKPAEGARGSQFHTQNSAAFSADANGQPATAATQPAPDKRRHPGKDEKKAQQKEHETKEAEHGQDKQTYASLPSTDKEETEKLGSPPSPPAMDIKEKRKYTREEWDEWNAHKQAKDSGHTHQDRSDWQRKGKMTDTEDPDQDEEFRSRQPPPAAQAHVCDSFAAPSPAILPPAMPPSAPAARPIKVILPLEIAKYAKRREKERLEKLENSRKDLEHYKGKARRERDRRKDLETDVEHYKRKGKRLEEDVEHYTKQARRERDRRRDLEKDVEHYKRKARRERSKRRDLEDRLEVLSVLYLREGHRTQASAAW